MPIQPTYEEGLIAIYDNRVGDLGWMLTRLLPLLQPEPGSFRAAWAERWAILDDSFRVYNHGLMQLGKPSLTKLAAPVEAFVELRFGFKPAASSYQTCLE